MKYITDIPNWERLLEEPLVISQKVDGSALIARFENGKVRFFNRNGRELDSIFRTTSDLFEPAIEYLEPRLSNFLKFNQEEIRFEYFSPNIKPIIQIVSRPLNNLVLLETNLTNIGPIKLAHKLGVTPPPIIFKGKLNSYEQNLLLTGEMDLDILHRLNPNFVPIINPNVIEGIVIQTPRGTFKATTKLFKELFKSKIAYSELATYEYRKLLNKLATGFEIQNIPSDYDFTEKSYLKLIWQNIIENTIYIIQDNEETFKRLFNDGKGFQVAFSDFNWNKVPDVIRTISQQKPWFKDFVRLVISKNRKTLVKHYFSNM